MRRDHALPLVSLTLPWALLRVALLAAGALAAPLAAVELAPPGPGPHVVGSTNLEVVVPTDVPIVDYLNGKAAEGKVRYLSDLLAQPEAALQATVPLPDQPSLGRWAGQAFPLVLYAVYPTPADNARPDHPFPYSETGDNVFPHMQRVGERPLFADPAARYPLIVYSGGYNTHGLWHLEHVKALAAHGYIVLDVFHGESRGLSFAQAMAIRPLALRAALAHLLEHPDFGPAIDPERIGLSGASAGAHTILTLMGAHDPAAAAPPPDPRIKAGVAQVPFFGGEFGFWPFKVPAWYFGRDFAGMHSVDTPFLALYAEDDDSVAAKDVEAGVRQLAGVSLAVRLGDESHLLSNAAAADARAWEILFFNAWLRGDTQARAQLARGTSMRGGVDDRVTHRSAGRPPAPASPGKPRSAP